MRPDGDDRAEKRPCRDTPLVVEHVEVPEERERRELSGDHAGRHREALDRVAEMRCEQKDGRAEHAPKLEPRSQSDERACPEDAPATRLGGGKDPDQRRHDVGGVAVHERPVRQAGGNGGEAEDQLPTLRDAEPSEDDE